jgi:hypothetical protein
MLGFVEDANAVPKIQRLEETVSYMMKQIHECALFIQQYGENGLLSEYCQASIRRTVDLTGRAF